MTRMFLFIRVIHTSSGPCSGATPTHPNASSTQPERPRRVPPARHFGPSRTRGMADFVVLTRAAAGARFVVGGFPVVQGQSTWTSFYASGVGDLVRGDTLLLIFHCGAP